MQFPSLTLTEVIVKALPDSTGCADVTPVKAPSWASLTQAQTALKTRWERLLGSVAADCYDNELPHWVIASPTKFDQHVSETLVTGLGYFTDAKPHWSKQFIEELQEQLQPEPHEWLWGTLRCEDGYIILEPGDCADEPFSSWELDGE